MTPVTIHRSRCTGIGCDCHRSSRRPGRTVYPVTDSQGRTRYIPNRPPAFYDDDTTGAVFRDIDGDTFTVAEQARIGWAALASHNEHLIDNQDATRIARWALRRRKDNQ